MPVDTVVVGPAAVMPTAMPANMAAAGMAERMAAGGKGALSPTRQSGIRPPVRSRAGTAAAALRIWATAATRPAAGKNPEDATTGGVAGSAFVNQWLISRRC